MIGCGHVSGLEARLWHMPRAGIADIAYHNKRAIYDLLMKAAAETMLTIAADPRHLGAP
jgi:hypothetical protein